MRLFLLKLYFGKVYFHEQVVGDKTPEMTAGFTGCLPIIYLYLIILMVIDIYTNITIIKESSFLVLSAIGIYLAYKYARRKDDLYIDSAKKFTSMSKNQKFRIMVISWSLDIIFFIVLGIMAVNYHEVMFS